MTGAAVCSCKRASSVSLSQDNRRGDDDEEEEEEEGAQTAADAGKLFKCSLIRLFKQEAPTQQTGRIRDDLHRRALPSSESLYAKAQQRLLVTALG